MFDSCSLTPPISPPPFIPGLADTSDTKCIGIIQHAPSFSCKENDFSDALDISHDSYLRSGHFDRYLKRELDFEEDFVAVKLFGKIFPTESAAWINMKYLFADLKKHMYVLQILSQGSPNSTRGLQNSCPQNIDQNVCELLLYFNIILQKLLTKVSHRGDVREIALKSHLKSYIYDLIKELHNVLIAIGPIHVIPDIQKGRNCFGDVYQCSKFQYRYLHLCMDIWMKTLQILFTVHSFIAHTDLESKIFFDTSTKGQLSLFMQVASLVLRDLFCLAFKLYSSSGPQPGISPFLCNCFRELWIMAVMLLDKYHSIYGEFSFWTLLGSMIQNKLHGDTNEAVDGEMSINCVPFPICKGSVDMCLWLISHVAPLYKYDSQGQYNECQKPCNGYALVKPLIEDLLSKDEELKEKNLRNSLIFCVSLVNLWEPHGDILLPFTDFYIKKIGEMFHLSGAESFSYLFTKSSSWLEYIKNIQVTKTSFTKETSFDLYLHILAIQMKLSKAEGNLWRSLKGRICTRFTAKKIREFSGFAKLPFSSSDVSMLSAFGGSCS